MIKRMCSLIYLLLVCVKMTFSQQDVEYQFSQIALQMPDSSGRRSIRQNWLIVPHLYKGDEMHVHFCIQAKTIVQVNNITYSNDGSMKTISVKQNGLEIGRFDTHSNSDWGKLWDKPVNTGKIGQTQMLDPGKYKLTLKVEHSYDCYGFEPWSMQITLFTPINPLKLWCESTYSLASQPSTCIPDRRDQTESNSASSTTMPLPPSTTTTPPTYVTVKQHSFRSKCLDKKNVKISFSTKDLGGTSIIVRQEPIQPMAKQFREDRTNNDSRLCNSDIWQLGIADDNNNEFKAIYSGKVLTVNLTNQPHPEDVFPAKLLPFVTTDIYIQFKIPPDVQIQRGSAYFTLGLVNVTMQADVGLRYYDHTIQNFSNIHVLTFTPKYQVMGWNIPNLGKMMETNSTIHLHFKSEANVIRFDFLRLEYRKGDERKINNLIARRGHWKLRGLRYPTSSGMSVSLDTKNEVANIEDAVILYQSDAFSRYETLLRINVDGTFYLYKPFRFLDERNEMTSVDISGFYFFQNVNEFNISNSQVQSLNLNSSTGEFVVHYEDGSVIGAQLTSTHLETKMQITRYEAKTDQKKTNNVDMKNAQGVVFTSTYINDYLAAVNTLSSEGREKQILENMDDFGGDYAFTFRKTTTTNLFYANNFIKLQFPR